MFLIAVYPDQGSLRWDLQSDEDREVWYYRERKTSDEFDHPQWHTHDRIATWYKTREEAEAKAVIIAASHEAYIGRIHVIESYP